MAIVKRATKGSALNIAEHDNNLDEVINRENHTGLQPASSISDFTEAVQDAVASLLGAGSNITLNYDDVNNQLTITAVGDGTGADPEAIRDAIGVALVGVGNISITVNDEADTITISTSATQNSTDAQLRDRSTHTGTQDASTISDFQTQVSANTDVAANTSARHTHSNKTTLDSITGAGSISYNSTTGVITYTDTEGTQSTIDLPVENLFQNASYDSGTQILTLTTNGGGTITVDLATLVDLPEIVLSDNSNPGGTPSTGQKVYFRADNGSVWIASAGAWVGPFLTVTQEEKNSWNSAVSATAVPTIQAETLDFLGRVFEAGGVIDTLTIAAVDRFILRGKRIGWWSAIKQLWVPVGDFVASKIFIKTPDGITPAFNNFVSGDYSQDYGFRLTSNSTSKYIDTLLVPNDHGITSQNILFGTIIIEHFTAPTNAYLIGSTPAGAGVSPAPFVIPATGSGAIGFSGSGMNHPYVSSEGVIAMIRYGATSMTSIVNDTLSSKGSTPTVVAMDSSVTLYRTKRTDNNLYYCNGNLSAYFIGTEISDTLAIDLSRALGYLMKDINRISFTKPVQRTLSDSIGAGSGSTSYKNSYAGILAYRFGVRDKNNSLPSSRVSTDTASTYSFLNRYPSLADYDPGHIILTGGTNDAVDDTSTDGNSTLVTTFKNSLTTIITGFQNTNHKVIVGSPPYRPIANKSINFQALWAAGAAEVAKAKKCPFADLFRAFLDTGTGDTYFPDTLHPNDAGHAIIAEYLYEAYRGRLLRKPTLDFGSIAAGTSSDQTVTVLNAEVGMSVSLGLPAALESGLIANAWVSANDTVTVRLTNVTGSAIDPISGKYQITVLLNY